MALPFGESSFFIGIGKSGSTCADGHVQTGLTDAEILEIMPFFVSNPADSVSDTAHCMAGISACTTLPAKLGDDLEEKRETA